MISNLCLVVCVLIFTRKRLVFDLCFSVKVTVVQVTQLSETHLNLWKMPAQLSKIRPAEKQTTIYTLENSSPDDLNVYENNTLQICRNDQSDILEQLRSLTFVLDVTEDFVVTIWK